MGKSIEDVAVALLNEIQRQEKDREERRREIENRLKELENKWELLIGRSSLIIEDDVAQKFSREFLEPIKEKMKQLQSELNRLRGYDPCLMVAKARIRNYMSTYHGWPRDATLPPL